MHNKKCTTQLKEQQGQYQHHAYSVSYEWSTNGTITNETSSKKKFPIRLFCHSEIFT